jgi:phosphatidylglycerophosphatase A
MVQIIKRRRKIKNSTRPEPSFLIKMIGSGLFTGYLPAASGTAGSLLAIAIFLIPGFESPILFGAVICAALLIGTKSADEMECRYGDDPAEVTIDEIVGMWISLYLLPKKVVLILAAFIIFRIMDIFKPFPARRFDRMQGGFGIMMDDVVSAIYTNFILHTALQFQTISDFLMR